MNAFESEFGKSIKRIEGSRDDFYGFKLFDTTSFRVISEKIFSLKVPCDFIAIYKGKTYFLECKSSKNATSYSKNYIKDHQLVSMSKAEKAGAKAYFVICKRHKARNFKCYAMKPSTLLHLFSLFSDKASIKWKYIEEYGIELDRVTNLQEWDIKKLFGIWE